MRSQSVHSNRVYDRSYFLATGLTLYVTLAACQEVGFGLASYVTLCAGPAWLAAVWRFTRPSLGSAVAQVEATARTALRVCAWGAGIWLAARLSPPGRAGLDLAANLGLGIACVAGNLALARIPAREGLVQPPRSARSLDAAAFCALLWGIASSLPAVRALWQADSALLDPLASDYATNAASIASVLGLTAAALRQRRVRRLELGVLERANGAVLACLGALALALPAALLNLASPHLALPLGALGAALGCGWMATLRDPTLISRALRGSLVLLVLGTPLGLGAAELAARLPDNAGLVALLACALGCGVGLLARGAAGPLAPGEAHRLHTLEMATRAALEPEPGAAVLATLECLQRLEQAVRTRPELWRVEPAEVLSVDVAGYLHVEPGVAPPEVYELAQSEPERLLRRDVLVQLEVRRPSVRPALTWMDARQAFAVSLVYEEQGPIGLLVLPQGLRRAPATLAEARAMRALSDRLSAVLGISSALARARAREGAAAERAEQLEQQRSRWETWMGGQTRHRDSVAEVLAAGVRVATYGTRARRTLRELEQLASTAQDVSLEVPSGVDPLAWACAFHQTRLQRSGPLVVIDATSAAAQSATYWSHPGDAPTRRAEGGTLVVLQIAALPEAAQQALARTLSGRVYGKTPCLLVATLSPVAERALEQQLVPALVPIVRAHLLRLPTLRERGEDLRGLVLDRLLRSGVRRQGEPLGIEPQALAHLLSYAWPGNDAELRGLVERAALLATRERVSLADLRAAGFVAAAPEGQLEPSAEPAPAPRKAPSRSQRMRKVDARPAATSDVPASDVPASDVPASDVPASPGESETPARRAEAGGSAAGDVVPGPRSSPRRRRRR